MLKLLGLFKDDFWYLSSHKESKIFILTDTEGVVHIHIQFVDRKGVSYSTIIANNTENKENNSVEFAKQRMENVLKGIKNKPKMPDASSFYGVVRTAKQQAEFEYENLKGNI